MYICKIFGTSNLIIVFFFLQITADEPHCSLEKKFSREILHPLIFNSEPHLFNCHTQAHFGHGIKF